MIALTMHPDGRPMYIQPAQVAGLMTATAPGIIKPQGTIVVLNSGAQYVALELPAEIAGMVADAMNPPPRFPIAG